MNIAYFNQKLLGPLVIHCWQAYIIILDKIKIHSNDQLCIGITMQLQKLALFLDLV